MFLSFSGSKLHFSFIYLCFSILIILASRFLLFSISAYCSSSFVVMPRPVFNPIFLYTCLSILFASCTDIFSIHRKSTLDICPHLPGFLNRMLTTHI